MITTDRKLLIAGLKELVSQIEQTGVPIILEPLNRYETHFINRVAQAVEICKEVGTPATIRILADFFHMSIEEVNIVGSRTISLMPAYLIYAALVTFSPNVPLSNARAL